jgi:hypothetical protein
VATRSEPFAGSIPAASIIPAVKGHLDELTLNGGQKPIAATAIVLAESLEAAPEYARARLARERTTCSLSSTRRS